MGLFSFLTGTKDDSSKTDTPAPAPAATPAVSHVAASDTSSNFHGSGTPFTPPPAWNTDSLTAPLPEASGEKPEVGPLDPDQTAALQSKVVAALKTVYDPEIPVDIYDLGLVYEIIVDAERRVLVKMTLTSPACPSAQQIPSEARYKVKAIPEVTNAWVEIVWEPTWDKDRMSEAAKLQLGFL